MPLAGGSPGVLASNSNQAQASGLALDATYVYWTVSGACASRVGEPPCPTPSPNAASINRVPIAGGTAVVLATDAAATGIAVDDKNVYWITPYDSVKWMPLAPGAAPGVRTLAAGESVYLGPVLAGDAVYWVSVDGAGTSQIKHTATPE